MEAPRDLLRAVYLNAPSATTGKVPDWFIPTYERVRAWVKDDSERRADGTDPATAENAADNYSGPAADAIRREAKERQEAAAEADATQKEQA